MTANQIKERVSNGVSGIKNWVVEHKTELIVGGVVVLTAGAALAAYAYFNDGCSSEDCLDEGNDYSDDFDSNVSDNNSGYYSEWGYPRNTDNWSDMDYYDFCSGGDLYED